MSWREAIAAGKSGWTTIHDGEFSIDVWVSRAAASAGHILVTAGVHGDEYEGPAALMTLAEELSSARPLCDVVLAPIVNHPAYFAGTRLTPSDGKNLARSFPGDAGGTETERLAAFAWKQLAADATALIDLHSGGVRYDFVPVAGFYGEASSSNASFVAAQTFQLPYLWQLPGTDGVLSFEAHKRGVPVTGCEYRGAGRLDACGKQVYMDGVRNCLRRWNALDESVTTAVEPATILTGDWQLSTTQGLFETAVDIGDEVQQGRELARVKGLRGETLEAFVAPLDGVILAQRSMGLISPGEWAVLVAQQLNYGEKNV